MADIHWDFDAWRSAADAVHQASRELPGTGTVVTLADDAVPGMASAAALSDLHLQINRTVSALASGLDGFGDNLDKAAETAWSHEQHHAHAYRSAWQPPPVHMGRPGMRAD